MAFLLLLTHSSYSRWQWFEHNSSQTSSCNLNTRLLCISTPVDTTKDHFWPNTLTGQHIRCRLPVPGWTWCGVKDSRSCWTSLVHLAPDLTASHTYWCRSDIHPQCSLLDWDLGKTKTIQVQNSSYSRQHYEMTGSLWHDALFWWTSPINKTPPIP